MFCWQITKYDPQNRDVNRVYLKDEWTDFSDIGKIFDGKELTFTEYLGIETKYIQTVMFFMECLGISSLKVTKLVYRARYKKNALIDGVKVVNDTYYSYEMIAFIIQSILRNKFDCMLANNDMWVQFDWDYYMTIGCLRPCELAIAKTKEIGLFVEKEDPVYFFEDDEG